MHIWLLKRAWLFISIPYFYTKHYYVLYPPKHKNCVHHFCISLKTQFPSEKYKYIYMEVHIHGKLYRNVYFSCTKFTARTNVQLYMATIINNIKVMLFCV